MLKKEGWGQVGVDILCGIDWRGGEWGVETKSWDVIFPSILTARSSSHQSGRSFEYNWLHQIRNATKTHTPEPTKKAKKCCGNPRPYYCCDKQDTLIYDIQKKIP